MIGYIATFALYGVALSIAIGVLAYLASVHLGEADIFPSEEQR